MCLFYVKWPKNHFLLMPFRSLGPQKRDFSEKTIEDFRLGAISPRQGRPYPGEIPGDGLPALPGTYRPQAFSGKQIIEKNV